MILEAFKKEGIGKGMALLNKHNGLCGLTSFMQRIAANVGIFFRSTKIIIRSLLEEFFLAYPLIFRSIQDYLAQVL